jgi:hypothetical protein
MAVDVGMAMRAKIWMHPHTLQWYDGTEPISAHTAYERSKASHALDDPPSDVTEKETDYMELRHMHMKRRN